MASSLECLPVVVFLRSNRGRKRLFGKIRRKLSISEDAEDGAAAEADEQAAQEDARAPVLDVASYQAMMESLSATAEKAGKGVVSVHAGSADGSDDWMGTGSSDPGVTGIIAADNGQELLILADNSVCKDADTWEIVLAVRKPLCGGAQSAGSKPEAGGIFYREKYRSGGDVGKDPGSRSR